MLRNASDLATAEVDGQSRSFTFRKVPSQATVAGVWIDLSMAPGNPTANYYAATPLQARALRQSVDGGMAHGDRITPLRKVLRRLYVTAPVAYGPLKLLDYLLYYPFIDQGSTDDQPLSNAVPLPRYGDGVGVEMMAVAVGAQVGGQQFVVTYTNSDGVGGRTTGPVTMITTQSVNGTLIANTPFLPKMQGDKGVRKIDSVVMLGADIGLFALVLVKPVAEMSMRLAATPYEYDFQADVADDAYLNFICCPTASISAQPILGSLTTVWSST